MLKTPKLVELLFVNPGALKELSINLPNLLAVWPALSYSIVSEKWKTASVTSLKMGFKRDGGTKKD